MKRSGRSHKEVECMTYLQTSNLEPEHNIFTQSTKVHDEYSGNEANVIAT